MRSELMTSLDTGTGKEERTFILLCYGVLPERWYF